MLLFPLSHFQSPQKPTEELYSWLFNSARNLKVFTQSEAIKWEWVVRENCRFSAFHSFIQSPYLRVCARKYQDCYWSLRAFEWCQNQLSSMTLNCHCALYCIIHVFSKAIEQIWIKIFIHQRQQCSAGTLSFWQCNVYADIRGTSNDSGMLKFYNSHKTHAS